MALYLEDDKRIRAAEREALGVKNRTRARRQNDERLQTRGLPFSQPFGARGQFQRGLLPSKTGFRQQFQAPDFSARSEGLSCFCSASGHWWKECPVRLAIRSGYVVPFDSISSSISLKKNKTALDHRDFVSSAVSDLLQFGLIVEVSRPPTVINPLSVSINSEGKPRLILDLRHVNRHIPKLDICTNSIYSQVTITLIFVGLIHSF